MTLRSRPNAAAASLALALASDPAALALLTASYAKPSSPIGPISVTKTATTVGSKLITPAERKGAKGKKSAKSEEKTTRCVIVNYPKTGKLDAAGFLAGLRTAGKRPARYDVDGADPLTGECWKAGDVRFNAKGEPIMVWDAAEQKLDEKACMIAFCGYSSGEAHGEQLDRARRDARSRLDIEARHAAGIFPSEHGHRSPAAYAERNEDTVGFVKGLPNPIRALGLDLCQREVIAAEELDLFGDLRELARNREHEKFSAHLLGNFPYTRGIEQHTKVVARPIVDEQGDKVKVGRKLVRENRLEDAGYRVIEVPSVVVAPLLPFLHVRTDINGKVDGFRFRVGCEADLDAALSRLEALAYERLDQIGRDLDALESADASSPETIERVSTSLHSRGSTACFESALRIYDTASRSHADLPLGTIVSAAAIERDTASDAHGILNTAPRA